MLSADGARAPRCRSRAAPARARPRTAGRNPVQVARHLGGHVLRRARAQHAALGSSRHRAGDVAGGGGPATARQDEVLERRQVRVETVEYLLQPVHVLIGDHAVAGHAEFPAQVEQVVLHVGEAVDHGLWQAADREHDADCAVRFVHGPVGLDAQVLLRDPHAVAEPRAAVVARARVDPAQSVAHVCSWRGWRMPAEYAPRDAGASARALRAAAALAAPPPGA